jgi:hypothetical protein
MRMPVRRFVIASALLLAAAPALAGAPATAAAKPPAPSSSASAGAAPSSSASATASAAGPAQAASEIDTAARQLFLDAITAYESGDNAKAYELLLAAWKVKQHWQIAASLGAVEMAVGKPVDAANHFAYYLREAPADRREKATKLLGEAVAKVGTITVTSEPSDVEIVVDGVASGAKSGEPFYVTADDRHVVTVRRGEQSTDLELIVGAGKTHEARVVLEEKKGARKEVVIAGAALAGASLVVGIATGIAALGASGDAQKKTDAIRTAGTPCKAPPDTAACKDVVAARNAQSALTNAALWSFVAAGAVGVATVIYVVVPRGKQPPAEVTVAPAVSWNGGGVAITGHW